MTIKQQGGVFGRNPTFNDITATDLTATSITSAGLTIDVGIADIQAGALASGNASVNIGRDDTSISGGNPLGYVQFLGSDNAAGSLTPHAYVKAVAAGSHSATSNPTDIIVGTTAGASTTIVDNFKFGADSNLTVVNGNLVIGTSGQGIDFSATSGTGTSELFDDYEEGTFTPVVADAASGGNEATASASNGYYTKVGRVVTVTIDLQNIDTTGLTSGNDIHITGLPFLAASLTGNMNYTAPVNGGGTLILAKSVIAVVYDNNNYIRLVDAVSLAVTGWLDVSEINSGATDFRFSVTYFA